MTAPKSKQRSERNTSFAEGGSDKMFRQQAAGPAPSGRTGKTQTAAPGPKAAKGGPPTRGASTVLPAKAGHTAPPKKGR